jgi:zinc transporter ZupT
MEIIATLAIFFGVVIGVVHYLSDKIHESKTYKNELLSLAAGVSLTYLLLFLLPELYEGVQELQKLLFLFVLLGAVVFHLVEKYIYQHKKKKKIIADLSAVHAVSFFSYHFIIGVVLVNLLQRNIILGTLFFIPIISYTAVGQVSLKEIHAKVKEKILLKIFLAASTLIGVIEAVYIQIQPRYFYALLGFVAGAMLYHVMRESIPSEKEGNGLFFLLGAVIYTILIMFVWFI